MLYGFTASKTPMQAATIESRLFKRRYSHQGKNYSFPDLAILVLENGGWIKCEEDVYGWKKVRGEYVKTKPKNEYRLYIEEGGFFDISKTEFDYVQYLVEHGFIDVEPGSNGAEKRAAFKAEYEAQRLAEEEAQREKEKKEEEERQQQEVEKSEFEKWLENEASRYIQENDQRLELLEKIYTHFAGCFGMFAVNNLVMMDNFNKPLCKNRLMGSLSVMENKATRKMFEYVHGVKLPSTKKGTIEFLNAFTV